MTGDHHFTTESVVTNAGQEPAELTLYRAADCYLGSSDSGFGAYDSATGAVSCLGPDAMGQPSAASRLEQFIPLTAGSHYLYSFYDAIWGAVIAKQPLPDVVEGGDILADNAMALSWTVTVPAGGQMPIAVQSNFSPTGVVALSSGLSINPAGVLTAQDTTVTVRVSNPNEAAQELTSATVTLPAGVEYVAGSAAGIGEPVVTDDQVAFNGSFAEIAADDALEFTFRVRATTAGTYNITLAAGVASRVEVTPSSAELSVGARQLATSLAVDPTSVSTGDVTAVTARIGNDHEVDLAVDQLTLALPAGAAYVDGSAQGIVAPVVQGNTLVFAGPFLIEADAELMFTLQVQPASTGSLTFALTGTSAAANVVGSQAALTVIAKPTPTPTPPAQLAATGVEAMPLQLLGAAAVMLVLGAGTLAARRRHAAS